jgi:hypothetical protein
MAIAMSMAMTMIEGESESESDKLNNLERLILAQAVYELGSDAWQSVSTILSHHPLIPKRDFSPAASLSLPLFFSSYHPTPRLAELSMTTFYKPSDSAGDP